MDIIQLMARDTTQSAAELNNKNIHQFSRNCLNKLFKLSSPVHIEVSRKRSLRASVIEAVNPLVIGGCPSCQVYPLYSRLNHSKEEAACMETGFYLAL